MDKTFTFPAQILSSSQVCLETTGPVALTGTCILSKGVSIGLKHFWESAVAAGCGPWVLPEETEVSGVSESCQVVEAGGLWCRSFCSSSLQAERPGSLGYGVCPLHVPGPLHHGDRPDRPALPALYLLFLLDSS